MTLSEFILAHADDDTSRLLLSRDRWPEIPMEIAANIILSRRRIKDKVPQWYAHPDLIYPPVISAEQCSSSFTAMYKASVAQRIAKTTSEEDSATHESTIADLTGGLGVDSWAFSKVFSKVIYNDMNPSIAFVAKNNSETVGMKNIVIRNVKIEPGIPTQLLSGFVPDIIYLDPSRRASDGHKVFLLNQCKPDVIPLMDELFSLSRNVLLKLSPMADISMLTKALSHIREIHIVSSDNECKELLVWMDRLWPQGRDNILNYSIIINESGSLMSFRPEEETQAIPAFPKDASDLEGYLFEPGKALMKAGAFNLTSIWFSAIKLGRSTHLYMTRSCVSNPFGKLYTVKEILPMNKRSIKDAGHRYPHSEVTARNTPMSTDALRRKLGISSGDDAHFFGLHVDFASQAPGAASADGNYLFITSPLRDI